MLGCSTRLLPKGRGGACYKGFIASNYQSTLDSVTCSRDYQSTLDVVTCNSSNQILYYIYISSLIILHNKLSNTIATTLHSTNLHQPPTCIINPAQHFKCSSFTGHTRYSLGLLVNRRLAGREGGGEREREGGGGILARSTNTHTKCSKVQYRGVSREFFWSSTCCPNTTCGVAVQYCAEDTAQCVVLKINYL